MPLYLVFTPIGNLQDITLRALTVLSAADVIAAEDTRHSGRLLAHHNIHKPLISLHEHNEAARIQAILARLTAGESVALISDAGAPTISDPGYQLVRAAIDAGFQPQPIPGPSAFLAALTASGLPTDRFLFLGFTPRKNKARNDLLQSVKDEPGVLIFYESPRRLLALLTAIAQNLGPERHLVVARELTKRYESFWRGPAQEALLAFAQPPKGEIVVLVAGAQAAKPQLSASVLKTLAYLQRGGLSTADAVRLLAEITGIPRRQLYQQALQTKAQTQI